MYSSIHNITLYFAKAKNYVNYTAIKHTKAILDRLLTSLISPAVLKYHNIIK